MDIAAATPFEGWVAILQACAPVLIALIGIIPTIIGNRKKTQESMNTMQQQISSEIQATKNDVTKLQGDFDKHVEEGEEEKAKLARYRILRFYDEVCDGKWHSESHYEDILDDIDFYETYCNEHPKFKNSRGMAAMEFLKDDYKVAKKTGRFLAHPETEKPASG